ncbi:MAG: GNAT family N-acetyltransferase [bacterium]|nr:GNAT family N-acetyltransferase [bacterium]
MKTVDLTKESGMAAPAGLHYERLTGAEGCAARALWERIFVEDTARFLDYYFSEKITDARIHVLKDDDGQIVSMVHTNPYGVMMHGIRRKAYYIVGVATAEPYRHRGCMAFLLHRAVWSAKQEGCPFVFLMPADTAIYEPFGFRYEGRLPVWKRGRAAHVAGIRISAYSADDAEILAAYAGKTLAERYDTYCVHDKIYFERLSRELASQNGGISLLWRRENGQEPDAEGGKAGDRQAEKWTADGQEPEPVLCGYCCYACEGEEFLQEVVVDREAEALFIEKSREERIMFLPLEKEYSFGRTYFPEIV